MDPKDAIDWNNLGYILDGEGRLLEAIAAYDQAIALDPTNSIFQKNKESALRALERQQNGTSCTSRRKDAADQNLKSKQDYAIDWNNKAGSLFKEGRKDEAIVAYDRAISLDPTHPIFWKNKAKVLRSVGRAAEAESAYELFESINDQKKLNRPEDAIYWNNKGYSLAEQGNHSEAIDAYNLAIKSDPTFAEAWNNLGYSLASLGRIDEAITACYRAVEFKPEFAYSWIEKWLYLPELVQNQGNMFPTNDVSKQEPGDSPSLTPPKFCNHTSGPIQMEPVFIRSKGNLKKYSACGWICPNCGQFQKK